MKTKKIFVTLFVTSLIFGFTACKKNAQNNTEPEKAEEQTEKTEVSEEQDEAQPLITAADLIKIYEQVDDKQFIEKNYADKGLERIFFNDYKNQADLPDDAGWMTEVWGSNMKYDNSKEKPEEMFTATGDNAIAVLVNHTDDADACIYFSNPKFKDIYLAELEKLGYKHFVGEDEFKQHYDVYAQEGYKPGDGGMAVFNLEQMKDIWELRLAYGS